MGDSVFTRLTRLAEGVAEGVARAWGISPFDVVCPESKHATVREALGVCGATLTAKGGAA